MGEDDSTSQPSMTAASTAPATIPITTTTSVPAVETSPVVDMSQGTIVGGTASGLTSHPAPAAITTSTDTTEITQIPSTEMPARTISQLSGALEDANSCANSGATTTTTTTPLNRPPTPPPIPETTITFLLVTGKRRTMTFPSSSTIGRVKELVWNTWPADWSDNRPPTPNFLRILYLGKMLQDEDVLETALHTLFPESQPGSSTPTIVHISIRPMAPSTIAADDMKKRKRIGVGRISVGRNGASSSGEGEEADTSGCCCIIC